MYLKDTAVPLPGTDRVTLIPALVCAVICVLFMRAGVLTLFFLVPLGLCSIVYGPVTAWFSLILAALGNGTLVVGAALRNGTGLATAGVDALYFTVLALSFTWIMAGNPPTGRWMPALPRVRTLFRFAAASVVVAALFLGLAYMRDRAGALLNRSSIEAIASLYINSSGSDAAQRAYLEAMLTPERIMEALTAIMLRGGALVSACTMFFFSRQTAIIIARLFRRQLSNDLPGFFAPRKALGVLTLCLPVILLCRIVSLDSFEIAAWNVLVLCAIMFLAQGGGIVLFNLARRPLPIIMRLLCSLLFAFLLFSPGINILAAIMLALLGIAENWLPLRKVTDN